MKRTTPERVNAGFAVALAIVAIIGVASITSIRRYAQTSSEVGRTHEVLRYIESVLFNLTDAESAQRGYVITGDEAFLVGYQQTVGLVLEQIHRMRELTFEDPAQQQRLAMLGALIARRMWILNENIDDHRAGRRDMAMASVRAGHGREVMDSVHAVIEAIDAVELERLATSTRDVGRRGRAAVAIIATGGIITFLIVLASSLMIRRDYTERRRAEFALRNSETLLSQFMENLPIGVLVVDVDSRVRFANNAAVDMVGPSVMLDPGERPLPLFRPQDGAYPEAETPLARALEGQTTGTRDAEIRTQQRTYPIEISAAPIFDARGRITYAIATFSDATEARRAEEALRSARDTAEAASRTKSDFLARISHELRTPLNSVIGFANILLKNRSGALSHQELTYLTRILENGKHLLLLINDILDLSKIEAGKIELEVTSIDLDGAVRSVIAQLEHQVTHDQVELRAVVPAAMDELLTDSVRLHQVLLNLISNALKFTERGHIEVRVEVADDGRTPARIHVEDTGIGIATDRLAAIFDVFEQAETSTARKYGGTGLGLAISRGLCDLLGYDLAVRSELGAGSTFTIDLQPARPDVAALEPQASLVT